MILGYGYFAPFRETLHLSLHAEDAVYARDDIHGQGGKALVAELLARAEASSFPQIGVLKAMDMKFGRWVDVVQMQKALGDGERSLPP